MKRVLWMIVACGLAAGVSSEARQRPSSAGIIVEAIEPGSAPDVAGVKVGDELLTWIAPAAPVVAPVAGRFRTPFDARAFELEQLPRTGRTVTLWRAGGPAVVTLIPGFWGLTVRPAFASGDLPAYRAGLALQRHRPAEALTIWRPLIERLTGAGDTTNAAWLLTRAGSALASLNLIDQADDVFAEAIDLCRRSSNPGAEAMAWEAKGQAYLPESEPANATSVVTKSRLDSALEAHRQALALRQPAGSVLATAESRLLGGFVATWGVQVRLLPDSTAEDKRVFTEAGDAIQAALAAISKEAPGSFAHARTLMRMAHHFQVGALPLRTKSLAPDQAAALRALRVPYLREARPIFERVAPTHDMLMFTVQTLLPSARSEAPRSAESEGLARSLVQFAARKRDFALISYATSNLAEVLHGPGNTAGRLALVEDLVKSGISRSLLAGFMVDVAMAMHDQGSSEDAISILERQALLPDLPPAVEIRIALRLSNYHGGRGNSSSAERVLLPLIPRLDDPAVLYSQRRDLAFALANIAAARGDSGLAELYATRALKEAERGPTTVGVKQTFMEFLAVLADRRGDRDAALQMVRQAIAVGEAESPPNEWNQLLLRIQLADLAGDRAAVGALTDQKLSLARRIQRGGQKEADSLYDAGLVKLRDHQDADALPYLREALPLIRRLEPDSLSLAKTLSLLAMAEGTTNGWQAGMPHVEEAMSILDARRSRSEDDGARALLSGEFPAIYANAVELLVQGGQNERAFNVVERSRARALADLLATRDLRGSAVPEELRKAQRQLESQQDAIRARLAEMTISDGDLLTKTQLELDSIRLQLNELDRRVSDIDPAAAARLRVPPITLAQAQARLDPGTVLLSYLTSWTGTYLFVVTSADSGSAGGKGLSVFKLPVSENALRESISAFNTLIEWDRDPTQNRRGDLVARGRELYDSLIRPAEAHVAAATRVLLSLDGPLLSLEFGALVRNRAGLPEYFAQWKPIHRTASMAVYAQTLASRRPTGRPTLVAFADPSHSRKRTSPVEELDALARPDVAMSPLPGARREAQAIARIFAPNARVFVADRATESRARSLDRTVRFVHFAVHAFFNDRRPLDSALVLTIPGAPDSADGNGVLQAWEIFQHMRIDADLVTLSACETGLGTRGAGEGFAGLTSAFLYAGARSVVASHWRVADGPTAELMSRFYANLKKGQAKDAALQNAQRELIRLARPPGSRVDYSSPAHWAAFTLTGDWK